MGELGEWGARISDFFYKESESKKTSGGGGGRGGVGERGGLE